MMMEGMNAAFFLYIGFLFLCFKIFPCSSWLTCRETKSKVWNISVLVPVHKANVAKLSVCAAHRVPIALSWYAAAAGAVLHCSMSALRLPAPLSACLQAGVLETAAVVWRRGKQMAMGPPLSVLYGRERDMSMGAQAVVEVGMGICFVVLVLCHCWFLLLWIFFPEVRRWYCD